MTCLLRKEETLQGLMNFKTEIKVRTTKFSNKSKDVSCYEDRREDNGNERKKF